MNIMYCGDQQMAQGLVLSLISVLKNTTEPVHFYILTAQITNKKQQFLPLSDEFVGRLDHYARQFTPENSVVKFEITDLFTAEPPVANLNTSFTPNCMLRLYADLIPELPDKILYLDTDVLCRQDFSQFYHQDLSDGEIAGTLDHYGKWFFHRQLRLFDYINSGVLLLNLAQIRRSGLFAKCRQKCQRTRMFMPDQSALNRLCHTKIITDTKYNEQHRLNQDTVFQHFTTSFKFLPRFKIRTIKPWQQKLLHEELGIYEYDDLLKESTKLLTANH
ncbi:lipopolysaccharide biosynthesis glycosyltransferase [Ligilactobacillus salitolerans]|uniref:Lipopolysaccharide biosynthesis glycosyltransferase n=2 Tax=Ligilactobacillus salitolerans TaxID=1808352 RepID=A0A401IUQ9_9LACO|nr:lipopolysaccharide biosynthesis glycosyltransferase [Ligilactobacillus salitolerans]